MSGSERGEAGWPWPPELDGPLAAPDHHRVIFENEQVRMLETTIRAGDVAPLHTHQRETVLYVLSGSHFIRRDETGAIVLDTHAVTPPFEMPRALWSPSIPATPWRTRGTTISSWSAWSSSAVTPTHTE